MKRVERTNAVMVRGPGQETEAPSRRDPHAMKVDRERNCYTCGGFGHLACHCRNQGGRIAEGRRMEYNRGREGPFEYESNLKGRRT